MVKVWPARSLFRYVLLPCSSNGVKRITASDADGVTFEIQGSLGAAFQAQPACVVTATEVLPPLPAGDALSGLILEVQVGSATMVVGSLALAVADPPPETLT